MRVTASRVPLLFECAWSFRDGVTWADSGPKKASDFGTAVHYALHCYVTNEPCNLIELGEEAGLSERETTRLELVVIQGRNWIDKNRRAGIVSEHKFAWDPANDTARELRETGARDYSGVLDHELAGTVDLAWMDGDVVIVPDFKTGFGMAAHPSENLQLRALALMAARAWGASSARILILHATEERVWTSSHDLPALDLDLFAIDLAQRLGTIPTSEPTPGAHCGGMWCQAGAANSCPAVQDASQGLIPVASLARGHKLSPTITSPDHLAWSLDMLDVIEDVTKAIKAGMRAYADLNGPVMLSDGRVYEGREETRETVDMNAPGALEEIEALGLSNAIERSISWASIKRAGGAKAEKAAYETLQLIGAIKVSSFKKYTAKLPPKKKKGKAAE